MKRLFITTSQNPSAYPDAPGGVSGAMAVPAAPICGTATITVPDQLQDAAVMAIGNGGKGNLTLFYTPGNPEAPQLQLSPPVNGFETGTGNKTIPPGQVAYLTDLKGGEGITYVGGPFTILPGTFCYADLLDPPERTDAKVSF